MEITKVSVKRIFGFKLFGRFIVLWKSKEVIKDDCANWESHAYCKCGNNSEIIKSNNGIYWCKNCGLYPIITA